MRANDDERPGTNRAADGSVRVEINPSVPYAVILTLIIAVMGSYGGGAWFLATQTATNASLSDRLTTANLAIAERLTRFEAAVNVRLEAGEKRDEQRAAAVASIDNRLSRMEAQLGFLVSQNPAAVRR